MMSPPTMSGAVPGAPQRTPLPEACLLVIFGASGDLMKRLLMPSLFNLACDGLLPEHFGIVGAGRSQWDTDGFRRQMTDDVRRFCTRPEFDEAVKLFRKEVGRQ